MREKWRNIKDSTYEVSNMGKIRNGNKKILKTYLDNKGRHRIKINLEGQRKSYFIHRLVAEVFITNPFNKPQVMHINGIKHDNRANNLVWVNNSNSQLNALYLNLRHVPEGTEVHNHQPVYQKDTNGNIIKKWDTITQACEQLGIYHPNIVAVCRGRKATYKGYIWEYVNDVEW